MALSKVIVFIICISLYKRTFSNKVLFIHKRDINFLLFFFIFNTKYFHKKQNTLSDYLLLNMIFVRRCCIFLYVSCQNNSALPNEKHEQDPSVVVTILIENADYMTM